MASAVQRLKYPVRSRIPARDRPVPSLPVEITDLVLVSKASRVDVGQAVTGGELERTIEGASTLTLDLHDPDKELLNSSLLIGTDPVDVKLDRFWFRLVRVSKQGTTLTLTFEDREVALMRLVTKPRRAFRDHTTRAEFVLSMLKETRGDDGRTLRIPYYIPELHDSQPVGRLPGKKRHPKGDAKADGVPKEGDSGFSSGDVLYGKGGVRLTPYQLHNAEIVLGVAERLNAPTRATLALLEACIVEAPNFANPSGGEGTSAGILQLTSPKSRIGATSCRSSSGF